MKSDTWELKEEARYKNAEHQGNVKVTRFEKFRQWYLRCDGQDDAAK